ncbi:MAG: anaerobic nitric oxide reductase flavorubredoxin [Dehalobacterium sp.]
MFQIKDEVYWVGIKDWELRKFHGEEYSTHRGSSYNSYVIKDEKIALVDTVWSPYQKDFLKMIEKEIGFDKIDLLVVNHAEQDHAGALCALMEKIPHVPIYCSKKGAAIIKKHFHKDWNFNIVKTGDSIDLGKNKLIFVELPMLHWPDSMATFVSGSNVLLSNDAFGQHLAAPYMFNDQVDQGELYQEAIKYFANILSPFTKILRNKIKEIVALNLPIEIIAPSHGIIWRDNPMQIVEKYDQWSDQYHEGTAVVLYDTMWGATKKMALAIARGLEKQGIGTKVFHVGLSDRNDIITEAFKAKAIIMGSSTINKGILSDSAAVIEMIKGLQFKGKIGGAFGSYGWSGESVSIIENRLKESGLEIVPNGTKALWDPTEEELKVCEAYGETIGKKMKE